AAQIVSKIDRQSLKHVIAAHLSQKNNRPELAVNALAGALGCAGEWVTVATQEDGFDWRCVN
ncbi:MAG: MBL fold metallo-hydrolase, partial [Burkholderiales bacterium]